MTVMATEMRKSGIDVVGDMVAWAPHLCLFYETKEDLVDTLISYCSRVWRATNYCLWIVAEPLTRELGLSRNRRTQASQGRNRGLNEELERRVVERTNQLMQASEALSEAQAELARINRVTTMGQLAASISHEVMQPIAAGITNAHAALRWLDAQPPDLEEVRQALGRAVEEGNRATDVIGRIRALIKKAPPLKDALDINEAILEVIALTRGEMVKNNVSVQTQLANDLPSLRGDRVQLQ